MGVGNAGAGRHMEKGCPGCRVSFGVEGWDQRMGGGEEGGDGVKGKRGRGQGSRGRGSRKEETREGGDKDQETRGGDMERREKDRKGGMPAELSGPQTPSWGSPVRTPGDKPLPPASSWAWQSLWDAQGDSRS